MAVQSGEIAIAQEGNFSFPGVQYFKSLHIKEGYHIILSSSDIKLRKLLQGGLTSMASSCQRYK
jgi:hypothetical protein